MWIWLRGKVIHCQDTQHKEAVFANDNTLTTPSLQESYRIMRSVYVLEYHEEYNALREVLNA